ncbi:diacylglycerol kinase [Vibrio cholerae]
MLSPSNGKPGATGFRRVINATGYSWQGLKAAFQHEAAIRQELALLVIAAGVLCLLGLPILERLLMFSSVVLVLIIELVNSAIEAVVDRVGSERHELSGRAKDIGSAAVMVSLLLAGLIWGSLLYAYYG